MKSENYIKFIFWNISTQFSWITGTGSHVGDLSLPASLLKGQR